MTPQPMKTELTRIEFNPQLPNGCFPKDRVSFVLENVSIEGATLVGSQIVLPIDDDRRVKITFDGGDTIADPAWHFSVTAYSKTGGKTANNIFTLRNANRDELPEMGHAYVPRFLSGEARRDARKSSKAAIKEVQAALAEVAKYIDLHR